MDLPYLDRIMIMFQMRLNRIMIMFQMRRICFCCSQMRVGGGVAAAAAPGANKGAMHMAHGLLQGCPGRVYVQQHCRQWGPRCWCTGLPLLATATTHQGGLARLVHAHALWHFPRAPWLALAPALAKPAGLEFLWGFIFVLG